MKKANYAIKSKKKHKNNTPSKKIKWAVFLNPGFLPALALSRRHDAGWDLFQNRAKM